MWILQEVKFNQGQFIVAIVALIVIIVIIIINKCVNMIHIIIIINKWTLNRLSAKRTKLGWYRVVSVEVYSHNR